MIERIQKGLGVLKETARWAIEAVTLYPDVMLIRQSVIDQIRRGHFDYCMLTSEHSDDFRETFIGEIRSGKMDNLFRQGLTMRKNLPKE